MFRVLRLIATFVAGSAESWATEARNRPFAVTMPRSALDIIQDVLYPNYREAFSGAAGEELPGSKNPGRRPGKISLPRSYS